MNAADTNRPSPECRAAAEGEVTPLNIAKLRRAICSLRSFANDFEELREYETAEALHRSVDLALDRLLELELELQPACEDESVMAAAAEDRLALRTNQF